MLAAYRKSAEATRNFEVRKSEVELMEEPLPADLGLSKLVAWAEAKFGVAPPEYWDAFRKAAVKLELRHATEAEYRLAARRAPKREDKP